MKNLIELIYQREKEKPKSPVFDNVTYQAFIEKIDKLRAHLIANQIQRKRIVVLQRPSQQLISKLIALMAEGNILIFIDPSLSLNVIKDSLPKTNPTHLILERKLFWIYFFMPSLWKLKTVQIKEISPNELHLPFVEFLDEDPCFYSLTTGSTGPAKIVPVPFGVLKSRQFIAQKYLPQVTPDIHLAGYTLSNLQNLTEGAMCITDLEEENVKKATRISGPPGKIANLVEEAFEKGNTYPSVKSILFGGAPIQNWLMKKCKHVFPNSEGLVIYGSTESEPISRITFSAALENKIPGYPVGQPVDEINIKLQPLEFNVHFPEQFPKITQQNVGELWISGPHVIKYYEHSQKEQDSIKVKDGQTTWHRTGDIVYLDDSGNLFLLGRIKDILSVNRRFFCNLSIEYALEEEFSWRRVAVKATDSKLKIYVETFKDSISKTDELNKSLELFLKSWGITSFELVKRKRLPVDRRHQWKIQRSLIN